MPRYRKMNTGPDGWTEWIQPRHDRYLLQCCDCGSTHVLEFRVVKDDPNDPEVDVDEQVPGLVVFRARRPKP